MAFTPEQIEAIEKSGTNIIVSAGAGSGKTAVLSERVIEKIKNGIHVNELLILTFTKAAANEMKDRIRNKIAMDPKYKEELNLLNSAYITTFDSFALSVVKKYHYLLNIPSNISITDESIVKIEEKKIINDLFEELYYEKNEGFLKLVNNYCVKNDKSLRNNILLIANKVENDINGERLIEFIKNGFFEEKYIDKILDYYKEILEYKRLILKNELDNLNYYFDSNIVDKFKDSVSGILNCNIDELYLINKVTLPRISKYNSEEEKAAKEKFKSIIDDILLFNSYGSFDEIKNSIIGNKENIITICDIINKYRYKIKKYKELNNIYTFSDISYLSIKILNDFMDARNEIKYSFKEIMIDEYQDTNDVQDSFIKLIENNNVYMVGDIKQSIYKFRGSNPNIFKDKYDNYSNNNGGYKIDLIKNFRSREEVLKNINDIFELIMDNEIGGASYKESHKMIYGNKDYDNEKVSGFNYNIDIYEYLNDKDSIYSNNEVEIFAIVNDIKNKIKSKFKVFDKNSKKLRDVKYSDFVIILDRSKYFNDYKKIFEYVNIPLTILKDDKLNSNSDILLIKNIFDFIYRISSDDFNIDFKYDFMSIGRSFLYEYSDQDLFTIFKNNSFKDTELYQDFYKISSINSVTIPELFDEILSITKFYEKIYKVGDYDNTRVRMIALYDISKNLNDLGYGILDFIDYLNDVNENGIDIKYSSYSSNSDSVKIMTIHKSKGLEYPICYFADLDHNFNLSDSNNMFIASDKYGLIIPNVLDEDNDSLLKRLYKYDYIKDEIGEKIRLFYVALTRAREKMIVFLPKKETFKLNKDENGVIDKSNRLNILKISDFIYSVKDYLNKYFNELDITSIGLSKNYLYKRNINNEINDEDELFEVNEINIDNNYINDEHFSKETYSIIDKKTRENMEYGTKIHEVFELIDFKNYDENIIKEDYIRNKINKFLSNDLFKDIKLANIYKEYEFVFEKDNINYHGIIDLMLEYDTHIDIVDYKLKRIDDENYIKQLNGYKEYIKSISQKNINLYLYSILDETIKEI